MIIVGVVALLRKVVGKHEVKTQARVSATIREPLSLYLISNSSDDVEQNKVDARIHGVVRQIRSPFLTYYSLDYQRQRLHPKLQRYRRYIQEHELSLFAIYNGMVYMHRGKKTRAALRDFLSSFQH